jgi:hypothetical protein
MRQAKRNSSKTGLHLFTSQNSNKPSHSIVAIHGLGGQVKPWSSSKTNTWIQDLATHMNWEVRIIRYAYDATKLAGATYPEEAISSEASTLLQKLSELRRGQQPVSALDEFYIRTITNWNSLAVTVGFFYS